MEYYDRYVKFCPECGKTLEQTPISPWWECFLHGQFEIIDDRIVWVKTEWLITRNLG